MFQRPRRTCRNRQPILSQPLTPTRETSSSLRTHSVSQPLPVLIQPSPRTSRSQTRAQFTPLVPLSPAAPSNVTEEHVVCPICALQVDDNGPGLMCGRCSTWFHPSCLFITEAEYNTLSQSEGDWHCDHCKSVLANRIMWGDLNGEQAILDKVRAAYKEITSWSKNIFLLPRGKAASAFIKELTRLINLFVGKTSWERLALPLMHVFMPIMLQKPSKKSKAKDHARFLSSRLEKWSAGDLESLMNECREIQKRLLSPKKRKSESNRKAFCRLMLAGKVKKAMGYINNNTDVKGVHTVSNEIRDILQKKHPKAELPDPDALLTITKPPVQNVIFESLTADLIRTSSKQLNGSGGPTLIDSDMWKHILCCKSYGNDSLNLAEAIAGLAKRLCCEHVHPACLQELLSSRLIPLDKGLDSDGNPGVRPIGIGEVLRRIIGKSVVSLLKSDVQKAAGCLQMCTGLRSGIEAAVHTTEMVWNEDSTEAILLVDADNAFNRLNRQVALHNVKQTCPPIFTFLNNHYQVPADLILNRASPEDSALRSEEGCTQGDAAAMTFYALGIKPLVEKLNCQDLDPLDSAYRIQSWYADDSNSIGKLLGIRQWWDLLNQHGPMYGYFPKADKTALVLKSPDLLQQANAIFSGTGIEIKCDGHRYLGAAAGSSSFKTTYVEEKVKKWVKDITELAKYSAEEPQIGLSAYTKGLCHRWSFVQRTIPDISSLFSPLEDCIRETLIPAIIGRKVSDLERHILSLPVRHGGLGISNPVLSCEREYSASKMITSSLSDLIYKQETDLGLFDTDAQKEIIKNLKKTKEINLISTQKGIVESIQDATLKRSFALNTEKGSGAWLTALPLKEHGYCLNKTEFRDAICLRYGWSIPKMPHFCGCGQRNSVNHTLICKKGGYVAMRHNNLRDANAEMQREVCRDVVVEPQLLPLENEEVDGVQGDRAAPDISSRGLWSTFERTFYDVRVLHPNAPSYQETDLAVLYQRHEQEKMRKYNTRVMTVERGSFTPLIYTTFGGWGPQATRYHKRLSEKLATKRNEEYHHVLNHMRIKLRFSILRSTLIAVRGERGKRMTSRPFASTSFNLIPEASSYESFL